MADRYERMLRAMRVDLTLAYAQLALVCHRMPIPVDLPTHEDIDFQDDMTPAVRRLVEIADDLPVDEDTKAGVFMTAIDWLTAVDLWTLLASTGQNTVREMCFTGALVRVRELLAELLQDGDAEYGTDQE
ncbi:MULTISPECIES: hypothetical protein [Streptomycetaceae]|uniref:hypothetical protein n=1 Tax=Streptomycetaceae TaxID=2062 RepID=UPI000366E719|nr:MULTISPECIES: hypothetical protein [Streptomycetaceae]